MKNRPTYKQFIDEASLGSVIKSIKSGIEKIRKAKEWKDKTIAAMSGTNDKELKKLYSLRLKYIDSKMKMLKNKSAMNKQKKKM